MSITVLDPGPLTTVQDAGRVGYAAQGYRSCGAADGYAYRLGNVLVGNDPGAAVLECTLRGAALRFETDTVFALTGAESPAALDSMPVPYYAPLLAKAGSVLQMGAAKTGLRSYLAVGGGIATLPVLGSRATDVKCGIGGLEDRKLTAGDTLPIGSCDTAVAGYHCQTAGPSLAGQDCVRRAAPHARAGNADAAAAARRARPAGRRLYRAGPTGFYPRYLYPDAGL